MLKNIFTKNKTNFLEISALNTRRGPNESLKTFQLDFNGVTDTDETIKQYPAEKSRRENVRKAKFIVKFMYNSTEMFSTEKLTIDQDFVIGSLESYRIRSSDVPKSLKLQIFESGIIRDTYHGEISVQFPPPTVTKVLE